MGDAKKQRKRARAKNAFERLLSLFADVRAGEGFIVFVLAADVFVLLAAYYLLKTARESLILAENGAVVKAYSSAAQAVLLMALVPLYGRIASAMNRIRLVSGVLLFFIANLAIFYAVELSGVPTAIPFFIWVGIFNVMAIAQFWALANDLFTEQEGKRLFPVIGIGSSLGAWLGAVFASRLVKMLGPSPLLLIAGLLLAVCIGLTQMAHRRDVKREAKEHSEAPLSRDGGFELLMRDRYLLLIAALMVVLNIVNTTGEYLLSSLVVREAGNAVGAVKEAQEKWIGAFYGDYFGWANLASFILQTFFVYRIFRHIGVAGALFVLPTIALGSYGLILAYPVLAVVRWFKIAENSTDYSIQNTARQALFLPTSREAKYKAKQAIDAFCMRAGDVIAAGAIFIGTHQKWDIRTFALMNVGLTLVWFVIVFALAREYGRKTRTPAAQPQPDSTPPPRRTGRVVPGYASSSLRQQ